MDEIVPCKYCGGPRPWHDIFCQHITQAERDEIWRTFEAAIDAVLADSAKESAHG
jgi:hypothetical protein